MSKEPKTETWIPTLQGTRPSSNRVIVDRTQTRCQYVIKGIVKFRLWVLLKTFFSDVISQDRVVYGSNKCFRS